MKAAFAVAVLLLAGTVSCTPAKVHRLPGLPDWFPDGLIPEINKPEWWPDLSLPEIIEIIENWIPQIPDIIDGIDKPDWFPDLGEIDLPDWWPPSLPDLPEWPGWPDWIPDLPDLPEWPGWPEIQIPEIIINKPVPGTPTAIEQTPSAAQIEVGAGPIWAQGCAGAIITNYHIVSSARCFSGPTYADRFRRARVGSSTRYESGIIAEIGSVVVHPNYGNIEENFFDSDIALVRLLLPLGFTDTVQTTQIVDTGFDVPSGFEVSLTAWGNTAEGSTSYPTDSLYSIDLVGIDRDTCATKWSSLPLIGSKIKVTENSFCVGRSETGGRDADVRDRGSGVYASNGVLVGVVSFGHYFGNQSYPVVATSISSFTSWIVENAV